MVHPPWREACARGACLALHDLVGKEQAAHHERELPPRPASSAGPRGQIPLPKLGTEGLGAGQRDHGLCSGRRPIMRVRPPLGITTAWQVGNRQTFQRRSCRTRKRPAETASQDSSCVARALPFFLSRSHAVPPPEQTAVLRKRGHAHAAMGLERTVFCVTPFCRGMRGQGGRTYSSLQAPVHSTSPHGFRSLISFSGRPWKSTCKVHTWEHLSRWAPLRPPPVTAPRGLALSKSPQTTTPLF